MEHRPWSIVHGLFHKCSALCLLLDQFTVGREFHFHFDLLETAIVAHQSFADEVDSAVAFITQG